MKKVNQVAALAVAGIAAAFCTLLATGNTLIALVAALAVMFCLGLVIGAKPTELIATACNIAEGIFSDAMTKTADATWSDRYRLVTVGTDSDHVALCGVSDVPLGTAFGAPDSNDMEVSVQLLGAQNRSRLGIASGAIAFNAIVVPGASGAIRTIPAAAGTYLMIGRARNAPADGETLHFEPCLPTPVVVS